MWMKALYGGVFYENSSRSLTVIFSADSAEDIWDQERKKEKINYITYKTA